MLDEIRIGTLLADEHGRLGRVIGGPTTLQFDKIYSPTINPPLHPPLQIWTVRLLDDGQPTSQTMTFAADRISGVQTEEYGPMNADPDLKYCAECDEQEWHFAGDADYLCAPCRFAVEFG